ncbi:hypothetical protein [Ornithinimicrobium flavum]|uniref:hypothetical protein n=1 Tax=Ornithinimicrobium flavum TaxID=1288636 RepID=UPI00106F88E3|nr:hypothetical protein [Ornithinimicrobium flavum]
MPVDVTWTSYGRSALDALTQVVAHLKQDDPLHPVTLVVPSNIAGIVARRHLARGFHPGRPAVAGLWITTLPRLAEQLAAPLLTGTGRRPATRAFVGATVRGVLLDDPGVFGEVADHPSTARSLARAHHDLRDVDDSACDQVAGTSSLCADVVRVHRATARASKTATTTRPTSSTPRPPHSRPNAPPSSAASSSTCPRTSPTPRPPWQRHSPRSPTPTSSPGTPATLAPTPP